MVQEYKTSDLDLFDKIDLQNPKDLFNFDKYFINNVSFSSLQLKFNKKSIFICELSGINSMEEAKNFVKADIFINRATKGVYEFGSVFKTFTLAAAFNEKVIQIELDPFLETADTDRSNNFWPEKTEPSKFELYKYKDRHDKPASNPMKKKK